jgi:hypothetical protein
MTSKFLGVAISLACLSFAGAAQAQCVDVFTQIEGNTCKAYVTNSCGRPLRCNVSVEGYTWQGKLYRENGVVRLNNGGQSWYGISGVTACGNANANCQ